MARSLVYDQFKVEENETLLDEKDFAYSFRPIYYFTRIFGLMPFSLVRDKNTKAQRPRVSILDGFWFIISICIYLWGAYVSTVHIMQFGAIIVSKANFVVRIFGLIFGAFLIVVNMLNRFKLVNIFNDFAIFDKEVGRNCEFPTATRLCIGLVINITKSKKKICMNVRFSLN